MISGYMDSVMENGDSFQQILWSQYPQTFLRYDLSEIRKHLILW